MNLNQLTFNELLNDFYIDDNVANSNIGLLVTDYNDKINNSSFGLNHTYN